MTQQLASRSRGYTSFCNLGGVVNCDACSRSRWGTFLGLPVSAVGDRRLRARARCWRCRGRSGATTGRARRPGAHRAWPRAASASRWCSPASHGFVLQHRVPALPHALRRDRRLVRHRRCRSPGASRPRTARRWLQRRDGRATRPRRRACSSPSPAGSARGGPRRRRRPTTVAEVRGRATRSSASCTRKLAGRRPQTASSARRRT